MLWVLGGCGAAAVLVQLPGGSLWRVLVMMAAGAKAAGAIAREDRRLRDAEQLHRRPPRVADLDRAPAPSPARMRRLRRMIIGVVVAELALSLALAAGLCWMAADGLSGSVGPGWWFYLVAPLGLAGLATEVRQQVRTFRRFPDPVGLPRGPVTVLGFTGQGQLEVVLVPGALPVAELLAPVPPGEPERTDLPTAFVTQLGWHLGELIPGDVLVCDGEPAEGSVVALATDDVTDWTSALRVLPWSEIRSPSFGDMLSEGWREGAAQGRDHPGRQVGGGGGRRAAVRQPDGSLRVPRSDEGMTPPWGSS